MKILATLITFISLISSGISAARADTVDARCDFYPVGDDTASKSMPCTFSQRQGFISIQRQDGVRYEFQPTGDRPGNFVDGNGNAVYRQSGLGDAGQIYRLPDVSIYLYWDTSSLATENNSTPQKNIPLGTLTANNPGTRINLRQQATINSATNGYGLVGDQVEILDCQPDYDTPTSELNWCQVRFPRSKAVGWIRNDFIIFSSDGY